MDGLMSHGIRQSQHISSDDELDSDIGQIQWIQVLDLDRAAMHMDDVDITRSGREKMRD
jgi:hypothetical protein